MCVYRAPSKCMLMSDTDIDVPLMLFENVYMLYNIIITDICSFKVGGKKHLYHYI